MWISKKQYDLFNLYRQENAEGIYKMANLRRELRVERERIESMQAQADAANKLVRDVANELDRNGTLNIPCDLYSYREAHDSKLGELVRSKVDYAMSKLRDLEAERRKARLQSNIEIAWASVYAPIADTPPSKTIEQRVAELEAKEAKRAKRKK